MVSQNIVIGIAIGMFLAGLAFGYIASVGSLHSGNMMINDQQTMMNDPQFRQQMMNDPEFMEQMMNQMMQNPEMMEGTMSSGMMMGSNAIEQHEKMLELMETMMNDKGIMNHMFAHMMENEQILHQMFGLMDNSPTIKEHMAAHVSGDLSEYEHLDNMHDGEEHEHEDEHQ